MGEAGGDGGEMSEQYLHFVKDEYLCCAEDEYPLRGMSDESRIAATGLLRCAVSVARDWLSPMEVAVSVPAKSLLFAGLGAVKILFCNGYIIIFQVMCYQIPTLYACNIKLGGRMQIIFRHFCEFPFVMYRIKMHVIQFLLNKF